MSASTARNAFQDADVAARMLTLGLPPIAGKWVFVDPTNGSDASSGLSPTTAKANIIAAHDACTTNVGDGIAVFGQNLASSPTYCTSYLSKPFDFSKNSITVFGVCAPTRMEQRARIEHKIAVTTSVAVVSNATAQTIVRADGGSFITDGWIVGSTGKYDSASSGNASRTFTLTAVTASTLTCTAADILTEASTTRTLTSYHAALFTVSGANNAFYNLHMTCTDTHALSLTCLKVTGVRNYFKNVHAAQGAASAATALTRSLWLSAGEANTFEDCTFGLDTVDRGNNATYDIYISGVVKRNRFINCETIGYASTGVAKLAVYLDGTVGGSPTRFHQCSFVCNNVTEMTAAFGANGSNDKVWCTGGTCHPGYAALGGGANVVFIHGPTASTAGVSGKLTAPAA